MQCLAGHLLVAPPSLRDPDFTNAVILVIQHSDEQAVGVVLNRPTTKTVKDVWGGKKKCECHQWVHSGGPVPGPILAVHGEESLGEIEILSGVYYAVQKKNLENLIQRPNRPFKIFDSHAGWGPGQLEAWLNADSWLVLPASPGQVFDGGAGLWDELARMV